MGFRVRGVIDNTQIPEKDLTAGASNDMTSQYRDRFSSFWDGGSKASSSVSLTPCCFADTSGKVKEGFGLKDIVS